MNPRTAPGDRETTDPLPTSAPVGGSSPDAATRDARTSRDPAPSALSARLSAARVRPFAGVSARLARLVPGGEAPGGFGRAADDAAAYREAVRQAFLSADSIVPAGVVRRPPAEPEASPGVAAASAEPNTRETTPETVAARLAPARPALLPTTDPWASPEAVLGTPEVSLALLATPLVATPLVATTHEATAAVSEPAAFPPAGGPPPDVRAGSRARSSGSTAPDDLLEVPGSVATAADDFFGGLVRRVERRP